MDLELLSSPIESFPLYRAAELIGLNLEELCYFIDNGAIRPVLRIEKDARCTLSLKKEEMLDALNSHVHKKMLPEAGIGFYSFFHLGEDFDELADSDAHDRQLGIDKIFDTKQEESIKVKAWISGYWISYSDFFINYKDGEPKSLNVSGLKSVVDADLQYYYRRRTFSASVWFDEFPLSNVMVKRQDLLELKNYLSNTSSATFSPTNKNPLPEKFNKNVSEGKSTFKQSVMIKGLLKLLPQIDDTLLDSPHKLHTTLEKLFIDAGIEYPVSDGKTLKDWLDKAKR